MIGRSTVLFAVSCAWLLYVIALYPLLLKILSKFWRKPVRKGEFLPTVSLVIPVRNAEAYMHRKLDSALALDYPRELVEVLVISDSSTDGTDEIVRTYAAWDVRLLQVSKGERAAALNAALPRLRSSILVLSEVWQTFDRGSLREMMKCFADPTVGMVAGEVVMHGRDGRTEERNLSMFAHFESWFGERLSDLDSMLGESGPFYAIRRPLMPRIPSDVILDNLYVGMSTFFRGFRIVADPAAMAFDDALPVETEFGDKIKAQAGDYQMMRLYPGLLSGCNRMRFHYLSYKIARLLLPFALITMAGTTYQLQPHKLLIGAAVAQGVFYGLATVHQWLGEIFLLKRLSAAARTFVLTMLASLLAVVVLFVPVRKLWKNLGND
jgi:biofilm PGA synthesis N-glycosyltransferase PgaC